MNRHTLAEQGQATALEAILPIDLLEFGHKVLAANDQHVQAVVKALRQQRILRDKEDRAACELALEGYVLNTYKHVKPEWCDEILSMAETYVIEGE